MNKWETISSEGINKLIYTPGFFQVSFATFNVVSKKFYNRFGFNVGQKSTEPPAHSIHKNIDEVGEVLNLGINHNGYTECILKTDDNIYRLESGNINANDDDGSILYFNVQDLLNENMFIKKYLVFSYSFGEKGKVFPQKWGGYFSSTKLSGKFEVDYEIDSFGGFSSERSLGSYIKSTSTLNWARGNSSVYAIEIPNHLESMALCVYIKHTEGKVEFDFNETFKTGLDSIRRLRDEYEKQRPKLFISGHKEYIVLDCDRSKGAEANEHKYARIPADADKLKRLDLLGAITEMPNWLKCYSPVTDSYYYPVNREWVEMMRNVFKLDKKKYQFGPLIFNWDTAFLAIICSYFDISTSKFLVNQLLENQDATGRIPQVVFAKKSSNRSNPPIIFLACWIIYKRTGDSTFLNNCFESLERYFEWFQKYRDTDGDMLFQWGAEDGRGPLSLEGKDGAIYESGMDNSPLWEKVTFDKDTKLLDMSTIDINSNMNLAAFILFKMSEVLEKFAKTKQYKDYYEAQKNVMIDKLWNENLYMFGNKVIKDNKFDYNYSPTSFYPLLSKVLDEKTASKAIKSNLINEDMFWDLFPLPSISKNNIYFDPDGDNWRGRIWPPMNYLIYLGLREYDAESAYHIADSSISIFEKEWSNEGHIHENYSMHTGWGEPLPDTYSRSCPYYSWGGLMPLMFVDEIFGIELWEEGFQIGSLYHTEPVELIDFPFKDGNRITVNIDPEKGTTVKLNDLLIIEADGLIKVRNFIINSKEIRFYFMFPGDRLKVKVCGMIEGQYKINAISGETHVENMYDLNPSTGVSFEFTRKKPFQKDYLSLKIINTEENIYEL